MQVQSTGLITGKGLRCRLVGARVAVRAAKRSPNPARGMSQVVRRNVANVQEPVRFRYPARQDENGAGGAETRAERSAEQGHSGSKPGDTLLPLP